MNTHFFVCVEYLYLEFAPDLAAFTTHAVHQLGDLTELLLEFNQIHKNGFLWVYTLSVEFFSPLLLIRYFFPCYGLNTILIFYFLLNLNNKQLFLTSILVYCVPTLNCCKWLNPSPLKSFVSSKLSGSSATDSAISLTRQSLLEIKH